MASLLTNCAVCGTSVHLNGNNEFTLEQLAESSGFFFGSSNA